MPAFLSNVFDGIMRPIVISFFGGLALSLVSPAWADDAKINFNRDVRPILSNSCFKCHGPAKQEKGLRLDLRESALKRKIVVPGSVKDSRVFDRLCSTDEDRMPPPDAGKPLTSGQIATLKAWIDQGAEYTPHWAFIKPLAHALPKVKQANWPRNGIDHFVLTRLEKAGLKPSPEADRPTLIRRLYLDLLGLLPGPAEVDAFLKDERPDAYEQLVERLLASPHYGERQARHWLDMARYADSNGYTIDGKRTIWPYRDWVVQAFNRELPFDQFTIEQLAGDLLPGAKMDQIVATGFHRNTPLNEEGGTDAEQFRVERLVDRTNTTGSVWLGLTVGCAQCHDHKYDALSQKEYYQLYAFFNNADEQKLSMATPEQEKTLAELREKVNEAKQAQAKAGKDEKAAAEAKALVQKAAKDLKAYEDGVTSTLTFKENSKGRVTNVQLRGDFLKKGDVVQPGVFGVLPPLSVKGKASRLDLARWLVSPENPLTGRVVVNRAWQQFFGKGLVETENDFGMQGALPTHPELLDWLALEFISPSPLGGKGSGVRGDSVHGTVPHAQPLSPKERGEKAGRHAWSLKALHRLIVTSAAYRQASVHRPDLFKVDPKNVLLGRQNRLRFEAEVIRDAALSASGLLNPKMGGPGVYPPQPPEVFRFTQSNHPWPESKGADRYRRGLYTFLWRQSQHPLITTFDGADAQTACTRRNRSNTPLQALHLANDPAFVEFAEGLGKRILKEGGADDAARIDFAFKVCFARAPSAAERERLVQFVQTQGTSDARWTLLARVLLNLDEFITRE